MHRYGAFIKPDAPFWRHEDVRIEWIMLTNSARSFGMLDAKLGTVRPSRPNACLTGPRKAGSF